MILQELETGLFLELKVQQWLHRFFATPAAQLAVIDALHGSEYLLVFEQLSTGTNPLSARTVVDDSNVAYKIKAYSFQAVDFAHIFNVAQQQSSFVIRQADFRTWNQMLSGLQQTLFI